MNDWLERNLDNFWWRLLIIPLLSTIIGAPGMIGFIDVFEYKKPARPYWFTLVGGNTLSL